MKWTGLMCVVFVAAGCGVFDATVDVTNASELEAFCGDRENLDGARVSVGAHLVERLETCTAAGCENTCCNACWTTYAIRCGGEDVELHASDGFGDVVTYDRSNPGLHEQTWSLVKGSETRLGCVGPSCDQLCTHELGAVDSFVGTFQGNLPTGVLTIEVDEDVMR